MLSVNQFVGRSVGGYQIERLLGQSQLGAAYLTRQSEQGDRATVTLFNLPENISPQEHEQLSLRFLQEGHILARMTHPHILPIYAFGVQPGYVYLITAFAKEASLAQFLKKNDRFTPQQTLPILRQLAEGLDYAHDQGIVHGMLSLSNVIMSNELSVRIAGFGLSTILEMRGNPQSNAPLSHLSNERNLFLLGNAEYIAPERVVGLQIDARADIYALGVMLFALLSGTPPFRGTEPLDVALQRLQQPVPSLHTIRADISEAFDLVIGQAMERDPAKRPQRAREIADLFERVIKSQNPLWGMNTIVASQLPSDSQATLPPTVNWFDEQVVPSGQWEASPPAVPERLFANTSDGTSVPTGASFSASGAPDSLGGGDPFAWWATTSTSQPKSQPLPGTFPWSTPIRKANAKSPARSGPVQLDRRKLISVLVTGAAVAGVTVAGISFARLLQSTQQSSSQIASGPSTGSTAQTTAGGNTSTAGSNTPTTGATKGTQQTHGTSTPSASGTPQPNATRGAKGSPTAQPTQGSQPTPTPKSQPTPTPTPAPSHTGKIIGYTSQANNSSVTFSNPADGQSSLLIRLANGSFVACERACTHAGVPVDYDSGSKQIVCPAHGAIFDPQNGFAHTSGPGGGSLPTVSIRVNSDGTITTG